LSTTKNSSIALQLKPATALMTKEEEEKITVSLDSYKRLIEIVNVPGILYILFFLYASSEAVYSIGNRYFGKYVPNGNNHTVFEVAGICIGLYLLFCIAKFLVTAYACMEAVKNIYVKMLEAIVKSPVQYFDRTPSGRILNRFSGDMGLLDM
jgi:ABC-type multidrug transport system fused ATPase/permease subunit